MNKKKVVILVLVIVLAAGAVGGGIFAFKKQKDRMENSNKYKDYYILHDCYNYYSVAH